MRAGRAFVGAEVEAVFLLPQVVGHVHVAQERQLAAGALGPGADLGNLLEHEILVAHHRHRHGAPAEGAEPLADPLGIVAGRVHHDLAADVALLGMDDPLAPFARHARRRAEPLDPCAERPRAAGQRLGELRRVDVSVGWIIECARDVVGLDQGVLRVDLLRPEKVERHALMATHPAGALEFLHPLPSVRQPDRSRDVVVHGVVDRCAKPPVEFGRVALHVHDRPGSREGRAVPCRVPGRPSSKFVLFEEHTV